MDLFSVIADPTRRRMIDMLAGGELAAGAFVAAFPAVTQPAISQHLKVLREAGVASVRADRQRRLYSLNPEALMPVSEWLAPHIAAASPPQPTVPAPKKPRTSERTKPAVLSEVTLDLFG